MTLWEGRGFRSENTPFEDFEDSGRATQIHS